jgi:hypothetical protein
MDALISQTIWVPVRKLEMLFNALPSDSLQPAWTFQKEITVFVATTSQFDRYFGVTFASVGKARLDYSCSSSSRTLEVQHSGEPKERGQRGQLALLPKQCGGSTGVAALFIWIEIENCFQIWIWSSSQKRNQGFQLYAETLKRKAS